MILILKSNKYYFLLKFRLIFLNFKYLSFIKINLQEYKEIAKSLKNFNIEFIKLKYNHVNTLLINKYINNIIKNNYFLLYFNNFNDLNIKNLGKLIIDAFSFSGYFINLNYINKLNIIYNHYVNNYYVYFTLIYKYINLYLICIFNYILKLLTLFLKLGSKKIFKTN